MDLIHQNPFRILGLSVDATERDITKRISDLETATEFGKKITYDTDFPFLSDFERTTESVREAASRIETAEGRFLYSLFWFWKQNVCDELALDVLKGGNIDKAISLLEAQFKTGTNNDKLYSSAKNLSILYMAISRENGSYNFEKFSKGLIWAGRVLDANLLEAYAHHISGKNFMIEKQKVIGSFIDEVVKTLTPHIDKPGGIALPQFISKFSSFPEETRRQVSSKLIGKHINNIEKAIQAAEIARRKYPENADKTGSDLYENTDGDIRKIAAVLAADDFEYQSISDKLAEEIADCSANYYNHHLDKDTDVDPGDNALRLARCAYSVAVGIKVKQRLNEGIPILEKWVKGKTERDKQRRIKVDFDYIVKQLDDVPDCDDLTDLQISRLPEQAARLVNNCKPRLDNIRSVLGSGDETYIDLSSAIARNAMGMCVVFANEKSEFSRILEVFTLIGALVMESDVKRRYDENFRIFKQQSKIKGDLDIIVGALNKVPDGEKLDFNEVTRLPLIAENLISICTPRLASIRGEEYDLYIKLSSSVASNALAMCIDYANRTHDMTKVMSVMRLIGELEMEASVKQRYNQNFQVMMGNMASSSKPASSSGGGCYVATMVYGSYDAPQVVILRKYRDTVLSNYPIGRAFIKFYYKYSPLFVERFKNHKTIHKIAKSLLDSIIRRLE
ncbi:MAG: CFI-box-CTERM domain-containing protein [Desulfuromonadaceae bacterium]